MDQVQINPILAEQEWEFLFPVKLKYLGIQFVPVYRLLKKTLFIIFGANAEECNTVEIKQSHTYHSQAT